MRTISFLFVVCLAALPAQADTTEIALVPIGTVDGTTVLEGDLTALGITDIESIMLMDDAAITGGAPGIFSGFDLDAVFLDFDGSLATTGDRAYAADYEFSAGSVRGTSRWYMRPNGSHPGLLFGALDSTTVDLATATLETLDAVSIAHVNRGDGFLSLGDGGSIVANFSPSVAVTGSLFVVVGEVGGNGENVHAFVTGRDFVENPEPASLVLVGSSAAWIALAARRRRRRNAA
ncbi:MAG: PEP-CTERM sorting domain-containing protein [Planctomycetota bacterium]